MTIAVLCSGQGGQHADMFALTHDVPQAASYFAHAASLLGSDPREWVRNASDRALHANRNAQLLCILQAVSAAAALDDVLPTKRCIAGYSVGEVASWHVAGLIKAEDTLDLIVARADAMDSACRGEQGMLFVRGLSRSVIEGLTAHRDAAIAIINPGDAYVLAGMHAALESIAGDASQRGATRVVTVGVNVASHTALMADATTVFRDRLAQLVVERTPTMGTRLFSGIDGAAVLNVGDAMDKLARQISQPIEWASCLQACVEAGAQAFLELGPGRALADMAVAAYSDIPARSLDEFKSIDGVRAWLARVL